MPALRRVYLAGCRRVRLRARGGAAGDARPATDLSAWRDPAAVARSRLIMRAWAASQRYGGRLRDVLLCQCGCSMPWPG
jgi:hypothetical protein